MLVSPCCILLRGHQPRVERKVYSLLSGPSEGQSPLPPSPRGGRVAKVSLVLKSSPNVSPFGSAGTTLFCLGLGRPVWGASLCATQPHPFCGELGAVPQTCVLFSRNRWEAWNQRGSWGRGGGGAWRHLWHRCAGGSFSQAPSLHLSLLFGSPIPKVLRPSSPYQSAHSGEREFPKLIFTRELRNTFHLRQGNAL